MPVDVEAMRRIAVGLYASRIEQEYGAPGVEALRSLLAGVHQVHRRVAYETISDGLVVFAPLDPADEPFDPTRSADVAPIDLTPRVTGAATIQVLADGKLRLWPHVTEPASLADRSVVYYFSDADYFVLGGNLEGVPNPTCFPSAFGIPTFVDLDNALAFYGVDLARYSTCHILRECWFDAKRHYLVNKPEVVMRRSLAQHLRSTLRGHELVELREEQNVDETHPIDIKVTWSLTNRLALIEVKWMGDSVNESRDAPGTKYRDARAREGAQQLSNYLDANVARAPQHVTRGYLVVFDARRRGLQGLGGDAVPADTTYYVDREVKFDRQFHLQRGDFAPPIRFFLEPAA